jgi:uncharacterized protein with HEPN domain
MLDKPIHHYFSVELEAVWLTATLEQAVLWAHVETILQDIWRTQGD